MVFLPADFFPTWNGLFVFLTLIKATPVPSPVIFPVLGQIDTVLLKNYQKVKKINEKSRKVEKSEKDLHNFPPK
jgi:hypothetical protein